MLALGSWPRALRADDADLGDDAAPEAPIEIDANDSDPAGLDEAQVEVVVRGNRPPRSASEAVRDRAVLDAAPHRTGSDLLSTVPGVYLSQHSGEGKAHQIFYRGFDAVHGQDLELWVAGAPVNEVSNIHGQGYADLHFIIPEVVDRIEAQPGVYDPRQGDFAVAGSMRYRLGYDEPGFNGSAAVGSFGARRAFLAFRPRSMSEANFGALELYQTDGFGVGRAADRASAMLQYETDVARAFRLRVMSSYYTGRFGSAGVLREDDLLAGRVERFDSYDTNQGGHSERVQVVTELSHETEDETVHVAPYFVRRSLRLRYDFTGYLQDPVNGDSTEQKNDASTLGLRAFYRRRLELFRFDDALEAGLVLRSDWIDQSQDDLSVLSGAVVEPIVDAGVTVNDLGGYVDAELHPVRRVVVRGGVRMDGLGLSVDDHLGGGASRSSQGLFVGERVSGSVSLAPRIRALGSWGRGFRSPQARSLAAGEPVPFTRVRSAEVGLRYRDSTRLSASVAGFRTVLSDDIVFDETVARNEPVPGTLRHGVAVDITARPTPWFVSALGFTYTYAAFRESGGRYEAGDLVPFVPQMILRSDLSFSPELGQLLQRTVRASLGTGLSYLYRRPLPYGEIGSNVFVMDVRAAIRMQELELSLDTYNLLNVDWNDSEFVYASNFDQGRNPSLIPVKHFTAGAPRTVLFTLALHI